MISSFTFFQFSLSIELQHTIHNELNGRARSFSIRMNVKTHQCQFSAKKNIISLKNVHITLCVRVDRIEIKRSVPTTYLQRIIFPTKLILQFQLRYGIFLIRRKSGQPAGNRAFRSVILVKLYRETGHPFRQLFSNFSPSSTVAEIESPAPEKPCVSNSDEIGALKSK